MNGGKHAAVCSLSFSLSSLPGEDVYLSTFPIDHRWLGRRNATNRSLRMLLYSTLPRLGRKQNRNRILLRLRIAGNREWNLRGRDRPRRISPTAEIREIAGRASAAVEYIRKIARYLLLIQPGQASPSNADKIAFPHSDGARARARS